MRIPDRHEGQDDAELQAPPELVSALKRLSQEHPFVPPAVDEAVLRAAQQHLGRVEFRKTEHRGPALVSGKLRPLWRWMRWLAAATAVITVVFLAYQLLPWGSSPTLGGRGINPFNFATGRSLLVVAGIVAVGFYLLWKLFKKLF